MGQKRSCYNVSQWVVCLCFLLSFTVSVLTFRSLIWVYFVHGVRECSNFISLHIAVLFSSHRLLKGLSFSIVKVCLFVVDWLTTGVCVYFWAFCPIPLVYKSVFVPVPYCFDYCNYIVYSEVRDHDASSSMVLSEDCFGYLGSFVFPCKF